jgi:ATP-binding protein involved in chromosome partitioning
MLNPALDTFNKNRWVIFTIFSEGGNMFIREIILNKLRQVIYPTNNRDIVSNGLIKSINVYDRNLEVVIWQNRLENKTASHIKHSIMKNLNEYTRDYYIHILFEQTPREMRPMPPVYSDQKADLFYKVAVYSPHGDVLKALFALNLAAAFTGKNFRVGLVEADLYGPGYATIRGLDNYPRYTNRSIYMHEQYGIGLISLQKLLDAQSPGLWRGASFENCMHHVISEVKSEKLQILLFDLPPGSGDSLLALMQTIVFDGIVLLTRAFEDDYTYSLEKSIHMLNDNNLPILGVVADISAKGSKSAITKRKLINIPEKIAHLGTISLDAVFFETNRKNNPILSSDSAQFFYDLVDKISVRLYH